jgi:hypothetical protein
MSRAKSPEEFAKKYKADPSATYIARLAAFLNAGADELPYRFFDRKLVAKIAYGLSRAPGEDTLYMKKLSSALSSASTILMATHKRGVWTDRVEGVRATVDAADLAKTVRRRKVRRMAGSARSLDATDKVIDTNEIKDTKLKREVQAGRREMRKVLEIVGDMPQLPPKAGNVKDDEEEGKQG